jgi:hypothetical protein
VVIYLACFAPIAMAARAGQYSADLTMVDFELGGAARKMVSWV